MAFPYTPESAIQYSSSYPSDVPVHYIQQYAKYVLDLAQQKESRLRGLFAEGDVTGEFFNYEFSAPAEMDEVTNRYADTEYTEPDESRRQVAYQKFAKAFLVEEFDPYLLIDDPRGVYQRKLAYAAGRKWDAVILAAAFGTVRTGHDGSTEVAWDPAKNTDCKKFTCNSGLNLDTLLQAGTYLDEAEFMDTDEERYAIVPPIGIENLLRDKQITSADYNTVKALAAGELNTFCGWQFKKTNRVSKTADSKYWRALFCTKSAIVTGGKDLKVRVKEESTKNYCWSIFGSMLIGGMRTQEKGVIEVLIPVKGTGISSVA